MSKILKVKNVGDYSRYLGVVERPPLVCFIDYKKVSHVHSSLNNYSVYGIFFHDEAEIDLASGSSGSQAAYDLGFEYPQHFCRMFKKQEGITPSQYCRSLHS